MATFVPKQVRASLAGAVDDWGDPTQPVYLSEFGHAPSPEDPSKGAANKDDPDGLHLHNELIK